MSEKSIEDEWFARNERELLKSVKRERFRKEQELAERLKKEEAKKQRDLHWMKCPKCGSDMKEQTTLGITTDQCTVCEGIFFDRGEFEEFLLKKQHERRSFIRRITGLFSS